MKTTSDTNPKRVSRRLTLVGLPSCIVERLDWEWTFTPDIMPWPCS